MTQGIANGPTLTSPTAEKASFTGCSMQHTRLMFGFIHTLDSSHQFYAKNQITKPMWLKTPRGAGHVKMTCLQPLIHPIIINIYIYIIYNIYQFSSNVFNVQEDSETSISRILHDFQLEFQLGGPRQVPCAWLGSSAVAFGRGREGTALADWWRGILARG